MMTAARCRGREGKGREGGGELHWTMVELTVGLARAETARGPKFVMEVDEHAVATGEEGEGGVRVDELLAWLPIARGRQ